MLIIVHSFVHVEDPTIPFPFPIIHIDVVSTAPTVEKDDTCLWVASGVCWKKIPTSVWGKVSTKSAMGHLQIVFAAASRPKVVIRKNFKNTKK
jgi:hypothetical protein